jgi:hypothetical protein
MKKVLWIIFTLIIISGCYSLQRAADKRSAITIVLVGGILSLFSISKVLSPTTISSKELSKMEAIKLIKQGYKISHKYFSKDEYLYTDPYGSIKDSYGNFIADNFWDLRDDLDWDHGYFIYEDKPKES